MFGPTYDIETNKIIIHEGTREELIQKGVRENYITELPNKAKTYGLNLRYQIKRKIAKEQGGAEAVEELNNSIIATAGESLIKEGRDITARKMIIVNGKLDNIL